MLLAGLVPIRMLEAPSLLCCRTVIIVDDIDAHQYGGTVLKRKQK